MSVLLSRVTSALRRVRSLRQLSAALVLFSLLGFTLAACATSATSDPLLAMRVNGTPVTLSSYQQVLALFDASAALQGSGSPGGFAWQSPTQRQTVTTAKSQTLAFFENTALLKQQLDAQHVTVPEADISAATAQLNAQIAQVRTQLAASPSNTGLQALVTAATPDALRLLAEQQAYTVVLATKGASPTAHAYGILVNTRAQADSILAALKSGQDFATLARAHSLDTGSATTGGDLGVVYPGEFVAAFDTAVFKNLKGTGDTVVALPSGYGVFRITARGTAPLSGLKNTQTQQQVVTGWVTNVLTPEANVVVYVK